MIVFCPPRLTAVKPNRNSDVVTIKNSGTSVLSHEGGKEEEEERGTTAKWLGENPTVGGTFGSGDPATAEIRVDLPARDKKSGHGDGIVE